MPSNGSTLVIEEYYAGTIAHIQVSSSLYQKYAIASQFAQSLDQAVAALALKSGIPPQQVI